MLADDLNNSNNDFLCDDYGLHQLVVFATHGGNIIIDKVFASNPGVCVCVCVCVCVWSYGQWESYKDQPYGACLMFWNQLTTVSWYFCTNKCRVVLGCDWHEHSWALR